MLIVSDIGDFNCNTIEEYRKVLRRCVDIDTDYEIWCSEGEGTYPCMTILGNHNQAVVNYFSEENGNMYASLGDVSQEGETEFKTNNSTYEIVDYQLIPLELAMKCVDEFYGRIELPVCIQWEEL